MSIKNEIIEIQKKQNHLKKEIQRIRKARPKNITKVTFVMAVLIFILEHKLYPLFGNATNFVIIGISLTVLMIVCTYLYFTQKIVKKERKIKNIGLQLYDIMRLENNN